MTTIREAFDSMAWGVAPESAATAQASPRCPSPAKATAA